MGPDEARKGWGRKPLFVTAVTNGAGGGEGGLGKESIACHGCDKWGWMRRGRAGGGSHCLSWLCQMRPEEAREGWGRKRLFVIAVTDGAGGGDGGLGEETTVCHSCDKWGWRRRGRAGERKPLFVTAVTKGARGGEGGLGNATIVCHSCDKWGRRM